MKFTPESLLQIYMDGSFTEEAQAEFDRLVRKDPAFAEKVSHAVAERIGEAPDQELARVEGRLDAKMVEVWNRNRPSLFLPVLKRAAVLLLALLAAGGFYSLARRSASFFQWASSSEAPSASQDLLGSAAPSTVNGASHPGQAPAARNRGAKTSQAVASNPLGKAQALSNRTYTSARVTAVGSGARSAPPLVPSVSSQAGNGTALGGLSPALPPTANPAGMTPNAPPPTSLNNPQSSVPEQGPSGLPALEPDLPSAQGGISRSGNGSTLSVSIETQKNQNVVVTVLDSDGNQVRQLYQGPWNAGTHTVEWDYKDDSANPVLPGNYTVVVNADGKTRSGVITVQPNTAK
jgi:hypothetical protein